MANIKLNGKTFITALLCSDNCCCVAIRQEEGNYLIADTKDPSCKPLVLDFQRWDSFKVEISTGKFDLPKLAEQALDISYHGISVRKIHSHIIVCDTIKDVDHSLAFTLKEWNVFSEGIKSEDFEIENLLDAA